MRYGHTFFGTTIDHCRTIGPFGWCVKPCDLEVGPFVSDFVRDVLRTKISDNTFASYETTARVHIAPRDDIHIGAVKMISLSVERVQRFYSDLTKAGVGESTRKNVHVVLSQALDAAVTRGYIPLNPCDLTVKPKPKRKKLVVWDEQQIRMFLAATEEDRLHAMYVLALTTGMRQGELFGLQHENLDLDAGRVIVDQALTEIAGKFGEKTPKTESGVRTIRLTVIAIRALRAHLAKQQLAQVKSRFVFCDTDGGPLRKSNVRRRSFAPAILRARKAEEEAAKAEGREPKPVPTIRFHALRHSFACAALARGVHVKVVSEMLGHANIKITLGLYGHALPSMQEEAVKLLDRAFNDDEE